MTFELRILLCVFLALNFTPIRAQKQIQREVFEKDNVLTMLRVLDQIVDGVNKYNNVYEGRGAYRYTQDDDSHEETNFYRLDDTDDRNTKEGHSIDTTNESQNNILSLLLDSHSNKFYSSGKSQTDASSLESVRNNQDYPNLYDSKSYLRSEAWKGCGKKPSDTCRKACEVAIRAGCNRSACKPKTKKWMTKECKTACRDKFGTEDSVEIPPIYYSKSEPTVEVVDGVKFIDYSRRINK